MLTKKMFNISFRHVTLPADLAKLVPRNHLMTETEWRNLGHYLFSLRTLQSIWTLRIFLLSVVQVGVQQSIGWVHYMFHTPEPQVSQ